MLRSPLFALTACGRVHSNRALRKIQGRPKFLRKFDEPQEPVAVQPLRCVCVRCAVERMTAFRQRRRAAVAVAAR